MCAAGSAALFVLPFLFILLSLFFGRYPLPVKDVLAALFALDFILFDIGLTQLISLYMHRIHNRK